jgi:hypothetical protein
MTNPNDWKIQHAITCILLLEAIRTNIHILSEMVEKLNPKAAQKISGYADSLKDWRELLEEFIPFDYDVGK